MPLFTPATWSGDGEGQGIRVLSPVEIGILRDLGYLVDSAPST